MLGPGARSALLGIQPSRPRDQSLCKVSTSFNASAIGWMRII